MRRLLLALLTLVLARDATASCIASPPANENIKGSAAVFTCMVLDGETEDKPAVVRVMRSWKGVRAASVLQISGKAGMESIGFRPKQRYLVFADSIQGALHTNGCRGTKSLDRHYADGEIALLGPSLDHRWWKLWQP